MSSSSLPPEGDPRPAPRRSYRVIQRVEAPVADLVGLSCREFARLTVLRQDRPLTTSEALRHRLHGAMCGLCARFAGQFSLIEELTREIEAETPPSPPAGPTEADESVARIAAAVRARINGKPEA